MAALNELLGTSSPNPNVESRGYQSTKEKISLDQKPDFKSPSTANSTKLEVATCRQQRSDPEEEHSKLKRELSIVRWMRNFDSSTSSEEILDTVTASSYVPQRESRWLRTKECEPCCSLKRFICSVFANMSCGYWIFKGFEAAS